jgi:hypothetical protein
MTLFERFMEMLGFQLKPKSHDYLATDVSRAVERNEAASDRARRALENLKQSDVMREIAGKM